MTDPANKVADLITSNYKAGEVLSTTKFDEICKSQGYSSVMDLARRVWSWKEKVNEVLMKQGLWLFTVTPEHIKLVDVPEHIIRTPAFTRLAQEIGKHTGNATEQLQNFKGSLKDQDQELALAKIVWRMENLSKEVQEKVLQIGEERKEAMGLLEGWIKGYL